MIEELPGGVVLVGTAHVAASSVLEVEQVIRDRRPSKVLVELDQRRLEALQDPEAWQRTDIVRVIKEGKQHLFLLQLYLASMQARMGRETGVAPGAELLKAIETAGEVGAEVLLVDRDIAITLRRGFAGMGFWEKMGLAANVVMEMLPVPPPEAPPSPDQRRRGATGALLPLALVALMAALPRVADRVLGVADFVFDRLVGVASLPALTVVLVGAALGLAAAVLVPRAGQDRGVAAFLAPAAWVGVAVGLLLRWAWDLSDGLSPGFLESLLPWWTLPQGALVAVAVALFAAGAAAAFRFTLGWRSFVARRQAIVSGGVTDVEEMLRTDTISRMTQEFAQFAPRIKTALIDERDEYMASHIAEQARLGGPLVAVVGAGHLPGIKARLASTPPPTAATRMALDRSPAKRLTVGTVLGWAIPLSIVAFFVYLGLTGRFAELREQALAFVLITGGLSALGCILALGHPLTVVVAFLAAPIGVLHPALATGWFAGVAQAWIRKPTVADFQDIKRIETMRQFWRNAVVRVLLVTALTNLGAMAATFIVIPRFFQSLTGGA